ncbi:MAG: hypothetical protein M3R06_10155, partial [Chloroflexota bacterium]|nr:hypothetical protein [Chloroflexota bacterium]
ATTATYMSVTGEHVLVHIGMEFSMPFSRSHIIARFLNVLFGRPSMSTILVPVPVPVPVRSRTHR